MPPDTALPATLAPVPGLWPDARAARRPLRLRLPRLPPGAAAGRPRSDWSAARLPRPPHARTAPGASPRSTAASPPADVPGPWPLPAHPFERAASFSASLASALVPVYLRSLLTGVTPWLKDAAKGIQVTIGGLMALAVFCQAPPRQGCRPANVSF